MTAIWKPAFVALAATLHMLAPPAAAADPVADFYKGKTVSIIVGAAEGGGFDVYARAAARHFPRHLPGSPHIIVQNRPGAGTTFPSHDDPMNSLEIQLAHIFQQGLDR